MLNVGVDSYVTLEEAEQIVADRFMSDDVIMLSWQGKSDNDKEVLLRNSCQSIDNLKLNGRKARISQALQFPRTQDSIVGVGYRLFIGQFYDNGLVGVSGPAGAYGGIDKVKIAQVINAAYASKYQADYYVHQGNAIQGLTSKKAGPIAESYGSSLLSAQALENAKVGIYTDLVFSILNPWVAYSRFSY